MVLRRRIGRHQLLYCSIGICFRLIRSQLRGEGARINRIKASFSPLEQLGKSRRPGAVPPPAQIGQLQIAQQPLLVGQLLDIAKIGLGGAVNGSDNLLPALGNELRIARHLIEQPAGLGKGIINFVDIGAQLGAPGSHATAGGTSGNPAAIMHASGTHQGLFDGL